MLYTTLNMLMSHISPAAAQHKWHILNGLLYLWHCIVTMDKLYPTWFWLDWSVHHYNCAVRCVNFRFTTQSVPSINNNHRFAALTMLTLATMMVKCPNCFQQFRKGRQLSSHYSTCNSNNKCRHFETVAITSSQDARLLRTTKTMRTTMVCHLMLMMTMLINNSLMQPPIWLIHALIYPMLLPTRTCIIRMSFLVMTLSMLTC